MNPVDFIINTLIPSGQKSALINEGKYMVLIDMLNPYVYSVAKMYVLHDYTVGKNSVGFEMQDREVYVEKYGDFVYAYKRIGDTIHIRKMKIEIINTISFVQ